MHTQPAGSSISEIQLQSAFFQWAWNNFTHTRRLFYHVPNGASRNKAEAAQLKSSGVVAGVWDMPFLWRGTLHYFEFKVGRNVLSDAQVAFKAANEPHGAKFYVFYELAEAQKAFCQIIGANGAI